MAAKRLPEQVADSDCKTQTPNVRQLLSLSLSEKLCVDHFRVAKGQLQTNLSHSSTASNNERCTVGVSGFCLLTPLVCMFLQCHFTFWELEGALS